LSSLVTMRIHWLAEIRIILFVRQGLCEYRLLLIREGSGWTTGNTVAVLCSSTPVQISIPIHHTVSVHHAHVSHPAETSNARIVHVGEGIEVHSIHAHHGIHRHHRHSVWHHGKAVHHVARHGREAIVEEVVGHIHIEGHIWEASHAVHHLLLLLHGLLLCFLLLHCLGSLGNLRVLEELVGWTFLGGRLVLHGRLLSCRCGS
jgi:hypothetical protein